MEESNKDDIFKEAARMTVNDGVRHIKSITLKEETITNSNVNLPTNPKVRKTWAELKKAIDKEHAERFNNILNSLPDREFARVYLKSLEFFKPKVIRQTGDKEIAKDTTINIQINK